MWHTPHTACTSAWLSNALAPPLPPSSNRLSSASESPGRGVTCKRPHAQMTPAAPVRPTFLASARFALSARSVWKLPEFPSIFVPLTPTAHRVCVSAVLSNCVGSDAARSRIIPSARGGSGASSMARLHAKLAHWYGVKEARDARALEERAATTSADPGAPPGAMRCHRAYAHSMLTMSGARKLCAVSAVRSATAARSLDRGS
mmetsp:Transcript_31973/g.51210  ORF Transcript_31973/g.51210 Transcript_31973/m.51210 type:complete len:203 (-) Transcript_31973:439-1047(-)